MSSHTHRPNYQYDNNIACWFCRRPLARISQYQRKSWVDENGKSRTVCGSCFTQLVHGVKLTRQGNQTISTTVVLRPIICKLCNKNEIYPFSVKDKEGQVHGVTKYPKFCGPCRIKFEKMVQDDIKENLV